MMHGRPYRNAVRGFTLVETLVAVAILVIAMAGPFYAVQQSLMASYTARDNLIASSLAQDGIEYIRALRDENYLYTLHHPLSARTWLYGVDGTASDGSPGGGTNCKNNSYCVVDSLFDTVTSCPSSASSCDPLRIVTSGNPTNPYFYTQKTTGSALKISQFTRSVNVLNINGHEAQIIVSVTWTSHNKLNTVTVTDVLDDWL